MHNVYALREEGVDDLVDLRSGAYGDVVIITTVKKTPITLYNNRNICKNKYCYLLFQGLPLQFTQNIL